MKTVRKIELIFAVLAGVLLIFFLSWHYQLGMTRYFDVDEYAHLHWASHLIIGQKPYVDFLTFFPPGFWWFLSPAFAGSAWGTVAPFTNARFLMFIVFALMCGASALIFWELRRSWLALGAALILAFLPLPFDKYLEIRPDSPAALFVLLAMYFQIRWMTASKSVIPAKAGIQFQRHSGLSRIGISVRNWIPHQVRDDMNALLSGFFYAASLVTLTKMLPNVAVGVGVAILSVLGMKTDPGQARMTTIETAGEAWKRLRMFIIGFAVPSAVFGVWLLSLGNLDTAIYSLTKLTLESNKISQFFIMMPTLFFYPNEIYYGIGGWSLPVYVNHGIWITGILYGAYRLLLPFLPGGRKQALPELLVAAQFYIQILFFVAFAPLKHAQYLIPIGVFVAWYAADFANDLWQKARTIPVLTGVAAGILVLAGWGLYTVFVQAHGVKFRWDNAAVLAEIADTYRKIPASEPVLDLDGRMLYNPDPYYACCIPFGQFAGFLSRPLPDLPAALAAGGVKYINQGELERVNTLPWQWQDPIYREYGYWEGKKWMMEKK